MRIWTLHPRYLDPAGLTALWRETLLARKVLRGLTRGYKHHPQLLRFREHETPRYAVNAYLAAVHAEAERRGYHFERSKVGPVRETRPLVATFGQLQYEWGHLRRKLRARSPKIWRLHADVDVPEPHPMFTLIAGPIATWETAVWSDALPKRTRGH